MIGRNPLSSRRAKRKEEINAEIFTFWVSSLSFSCSGLNGERAGATGGAGAGPEAGYLWMSGGPAALVKPPQGYANSRSYCSDITTVVDPAGTAGCSGEGRVGRRAP